MSEAKAAQKRSGLLFASCDVLAGLRDNADYRIDAVPWIWKDRA